MENEELPKVVQSWSMASKGTDSPTSDGSEPIVAPLFSIGVGILGAVEEVPSGKAELSKTADKESVPELPSSKGLSGMPGKPLIGCLDQFCSSENGSTDVDASATEIPDPSTEFEVSQNDDGNDVSFKPDEPTFVNDHLYFTSKRPVKSKKKSQKGLSKSDSDSWTENHSENADRTSSLPPVKIMRTGFALTNANGIKLMKAEIGPDYYLKIANSKEEVYKVLESLQEQFGIVLQLKRTDPNFGTPEWKPRRLKRKNRPTSQGYGNVFWAYELVTGKELTPPIKYDGMPFMHVATRVFQCAGSAADGSHDKLTIRRYHPLKGPRSARKVKKSAAQTPGQETNEAIAELLKTHSVKSPLKNFLLTGDHDEISHDLGNDFEGQTEVELESEDAWEHCPYKLGVKQVIKFPKFSIGKSEPPSSRDKLMIRKIIISAIEKKTVEELGGVMKYYIKIPLIDAHQNHEVRLMPPVYTSEKYHSWLLTRLHEHTKPDTFEPPTSHLHLQLDQKDHKMRVHSLVMSSASPVLEYAIENNNLCQALADILTPMDATTLEVFVRFLYCGELTIQAGCSIEALEKAFTAAKMLEGLKLIEKHKERSQLEWVEAVEKDCAVHKPSVATQTTLEDFCLMAESEEKVSEAVDTSGLDTLDELPLRIDANLRPEDGTGYINQVQSALQILFPKHSSFHDYQYIKKWTMAGFSLGEIVRQVLTRRLRKVNLMQEVFSWYPESACKACREDCRAKEHFLNAEVCDEDMNRDPEEELLDFLQDVLHKTKQEEQTEFSESSPDAEQENNEASQGKSKPLEHLKTASGEMIPLSKSQSRMLQKILEAKNQDLNKEYKAPDPAKPNPASVKKLQVIVPKNSSKKEVYDAVNSYLNTSETSSPKLKSGKKRKLPIDDLVVLQDDPETGKKVTKKLFSKEPPKSSFVVKKVKTQKQGAVEKNPFVVRVGEPVNRSVVKPVPKGNPNTPMFKTVNPIAQTSAASSPVVIKTETLAPKVTSTPKVTPLQNLISTPKVSSIQRVTSATKGQSVPVSLKTYSASESPAGGKVTSSVTSVLGSSMPAHKLKAAMSESEYGAFETSLLNVMQGQDFDPDKPVIVYVNPDVVVTKVDGT